MSSPLIMAAALVCLSACSGQSSSPPSPTTVPPAVPSPAPAPAGPVVVPTGYSRPPQALLDVLHAPASPSPMLSPTRDRMLLVTWVEYPPISQVAEPFLRLAGVRVEPRTRRKHDTPAGYGVAPCASAIALLDVASGAQTPTSLPPGACADGFTWAADGKRFAFRNTSSEAVELWVGDLDGKLRRLGAHRLNPMLGSSLQWMPDQQRLLVKLVPTDAGPPPSNAATLTGPAIQETSVGGGEFSTYEARDTLKSPQDEALFEYYATSQLAIVDIASGAATSLGVPGVLTGVDPAPGGQHVLVTTLRKPYSYDVTYDRFAHDVEVWGVGGGVTSLAKLPVADRVPIHGVPTGPRDHAWRPTEPATLIWSEALDGGDWNVEVPARDKVMVQRAPFTTPATELTRTTQRYAGHAWLADGARALLYEYDVNRRWYRAHLVTPDDAAVAPTLLWDLSYDERYADPGNPQYDTLPTGAAVVRVEGDRIYLSGVGATPDGDRPFLDRFDLRTRTAERLFRSERTALEYFLALTGPGAESFLTWHQSPTDVPNAWVRTLGAAVADAPAGEARFESTRTRNVTNLPDPTPQVRAIKKRLVRYKRADGVELSFTLYTPPGYVEGTRLPAVLYAYPLDYASAATAGQVSGSEQVFTQLRGHQLLLLAGYAVIDDAAFPIVGDPKHAYDTYLPQLVANARAAIDKAVELGVVDRDRVGVTGHSHGALMTINLLAHTDLFRAGVATSGAYNKSLTPFGFQNERRTLWQDRDVYVDLSPLFVADRIKEPLLMVHGADDANPGTTPLQSTKMYEALRGTGATARLVMLPHEPHWYAAMESNEQLAYEMLRWFDAHVKGSERQPGGGGAPAPAAGDAP